MRFPYFRILLMVAILGATLYGVVHRQNEVTRYRLEIPKLERKSLLLEQENLRLQYELEHLKSPHNLLQWYRDPDFSGMICPSQDTIECLNFKD